MFSRKSGSESRGSSHQLLPLCENCHVSTLVAIAAYLLLPIFRLFREKYKQKSGNTANIILPKFVHADTTSNTRSQKLLMVKVAYRCEKVDSSGYDI